MSCFVLFEDLFILRQSYKEREESESSAGSLSKWAQWLDLGCAAARGEELPSGMPPGTST